MGYTTFYKMYFVHNQKQKNIGARTHMNAADYKGVLYYVKTRNKQCDAYIHAGTTTAIINDYRCSQTASLYLISEYIGDFN